jgi:hypothetical protein
MSSNNYSKSCTPNLGGVKDFYTREEIVNLLKLKADRFNTYTKEQIDAFINSVITGTGFATAAQGELADTAVQPEDLGTAAYTDSDDYATAAQGALADTAVQTSELGTAAYTDSADYATSAQGSLADTAIQPEDLGTAAYTDSTDYATSGQGTLADTAIQPEDLGTAAYTDSTDYATASQGALADTAVQPADLVVERQVFNAATAVLPDSDTGYIQISAYSAYALVEMTPSHPSRIRIYSSNASRTADLSRPVSTPPEYGSGIIAEILTSTDGYRQIFTPMVTGGNLETPFSKNVYLSVTNLSGSSREIGVSLTLLRLERNPVT